MRNYFGGWRNETKLRGLKKVGKKSGVQKIFREKIRGLKKISVFWKDYPSRYPDEKMTEEACERWCVERFCNFVCFLLTSNKFHVRTSDVKTLISEGKFCEFTSYVWHKLIWFGKRKCIFKAEHFEHLIESFKKSFFWTFP